MNKSLSLGCFLSCVLVVSLDASAFEESPKGDSMFYYRIGGGRHTQLPPSLHVTTINLSVAAEYTNLHCGKFDPIASIKSSLDDLKDGADEAINAIELAAGAAITNLPGYLLQKANPGLYDLFQNGLLRAQESFSIATKSCERMEYEIANNKNPFDEWITVSRGDSWRRSIGFGEENIHEAAEDAKSGNNLGVRWIGGLYRGGVNQHPIRVVAEVAGAGLNILANRKPEVTSDLPSSAPLADQFSGPNEVRDWIDEVLGDMEVGVCDACSKGAQPGKGLIPYIEAQTEDIAQNLKDIVTGSLAPTPDNLRTLAAPGIKITPQVIEAIKNQPSSERTILIEKLSQEIAQVRTIEEAMTVRRFLLTGKKEVNVSANAMAKDFVEKSLDELDKEIESVIFEKQIRQQFVANTIVEVLLKDNAMRQASANMRVKTKSDERPLKQGTVK